MSRPALMLAAWFALACLARGQADPVRVVVPDPSGWVGQRIPVFVELRAPGSFDGAAAFELPLVPGSLLLKIGNPVVSSERGADREWFVQTHEFALFSQRAGVVEVPPFSVRFAHREGYTGPSSERSEQVPGWSVELRSPPGRRGRGFLVTSESLEVSESWDPQPGPVQVGAVFKREVVQRAEQVSGMALAPASSEAPEGVRVYAGEASTRDTIQRGAFRGERRETITYVLTASGSVSLPALEFPWWDPKSETLRTSSLPAVTLDVAPAPVADAAAVSGEGPPSRLLPGLATGVALLALGVWQASRLRRWGRRLHARLDPPERVAARGLRRACRRHDATAAARAWDTWRGTCPAAPRPDPGLDAALRELQRRLFGGGPAEPWTGDELARAFAAWRAAARRRGSASRRASALPPLNPN